MPAQTCGRANIAARGLQQQSRKKETEAASGGKIAKADVSIAKNYFSETELSYLERIVSLTEGI